MAYVEYEKKGHIAYITLNRPERMNALGSELGRQLGEAEANFAFDDDAWVAIYTGAGENKPAMAFSLIHSWALEIPMALVLTRVLYVNQNGVWWAISVASILSSLLFYLWFRRGGWVRKSV